jgi:DNA-binding transcriptional MerR regulator
MIKRAQILGFTLAEIAPLILAKQTERDFPLDVANCTIDKKRDQIKLEIKKAKKLDLALISLKKDLNIMFS